MLAVVSPSPDVAHRLPSSSSSRNLAPHHPPSQQRHHSAPRPPTPPPPEPDAEAAPFDIHSYPPPDLLKLLAHILTHIATTNDHLSPTASSSPHSHHHTPHEPIDAPPIWHTLTTAARNAISTPAATLTFHARNIPTISLEAYLLRILKYCPTSNHVFLSLLVYFDRMSKLGQEAVGRAFVIDSYNIHRLVIAGITVASKFFSDVFYTNSRYAKVGGLPLPELNQLELQFLLLNDFRLVVSSADMQDYAEQLLHFSQASPPPSAPHLRLPPIPSSRTHHPPHASSSTSHPPSATSSTISSIHSHGGSSHLNGHPPSPPHPAPTPASASSSTIATPAPSDSSSGSSTATPGALSSSSSSSRSTVAGSRTPTFPSTSTPFGFAAAASGLPSSSSSSKSSGSFWNAHPSSSSSSNTHRFPNTHPHPHPHASHASHAPHPHLPPPPRTRRQSYDSTSSRSDADDDSASEVDADGDASTDAGTEAETETNASTSTDDEPTIRGPRTVVGDERMGSP